MKTFVITIMDLPESIDSAITTANTCSLYGLSAELFPATVPEDNPTEIIHRILGREISTNVLRLEDRMDRVLSCLASQMRLWEWCACDKNSEDFLILEHDARMIAPMPDIEVDGVISLGKPSFNEEQHSTHSWKDGINILEGQHRHFYGNHAILMSPAGAKEVLERMRDPSLRFLHPADLLMKPSIMGEGLLKEYYPFPFDVEEKFTTVQGDRGTSIKNNVPDDYQQL